MEMGVWAVLVEAVATEVWADRYRATVATVVPVAQVVLAGAAATGQMESTTPTKNLWLAPGVLVAQAAPVVWAVKAVWAVQPSAQALRA
ncbi:hypothetical protein A5715_07140 [Mycolicibacter heraklionensis]|nr:hypothetical protein A5715_07140 [Mycolicibacter heraklionensis]